MHHEIVKAGKKELLTRSGQKSSRIMEDQADLSGLFGIDLDGGAAGQTRTGIQRGLPLDQVI
ncbi:MAG: hypothetical protein U5K27_14600 [Desulfotignum sp.]|nr:hypothetical protein [Desulfotignum sp.]